THLIGPCVFDGFRAQQPPTRTQDDTVIDYNLWQGLSIRNSWINGNVNLGANVSQAVIENNQFDRYNGVSWEYFGVTGNVGVVTMMASDNHRLGVGGIVDTQYPLEVLGTIYSRSAATATDGTMLLSHGSGYSILKSVNKADATRRALKFQQQYQSGGAQIDTTAEFDTTGDLNIYHDTIITADTSPIGDAQTEAGLRIKDAGNDTMLTAGVNATGNYGYLQTVQPGVSWTSRHLVLNPLGGYVGIGLEDPAQALEILGTVCTRGATSTDKTYLLTHSSHYSVLRAVNTGGATRLPLWFQQQWENGGTQQETVGGFDASGTMQVYRDLNVAGALTLGTVLAAAEGGTGGVHVYNNRGDVAAADYAVGNFTCDNTWRDLDLSGIVGVGQRLVHLRVGISDADAYTYAYFRKNGQVNAINIAQVRVQNYAVSYLAQVWVETDANGVIEYLVNATPDALGVTVLGWMK
ncbi:MAG: hypothetical protein M1376_15590, partial [Planctomycetes bacterium]|nr:hypothetical protein [Planctomycetota bacterium]